MNRIDIRREVHRVIGGVQETRRMSFPHDERAADMVINITNAFVQHAGSTTQEQRAQFIRKVATYITRAGWKGDTVTHIFGVLWFADHPEHLFKRIGFGAAIDAQRQAFAEKFNNARFLTNEELMHDLDKVPLVPKPIVHVLGDFTLEQLVHAAHLVEAGLALNNCLKVRRDDRVLPNTVYWTPMTRGQRQLFTVRHRDRFCFALEIAKGRVTHIQLDQAPPEFYPALPVFAKRIEAILGPIDAGHYHHFWPTPVHFMPPDPAQLALFGQPRRRNARHPEIPPQLLGGHK